MIVVDVEFSGLDAYKDSIVSIGAIEFENPQNQFYGECRIWPGAHINKEAIAVNGFTIDEINDPKKQSDSELVMAFIDWASKCEDHTLAGQNPYLDMEFIHYAVKRYSIDWNFAHRTIDMHSLCYLHMIKKGFTPPIENKRTDLDSDKIMKYVGIPVEPHPHNALNGAKYETEAIGRLLYDRKLFPEFEKYPIPWVAQGDLQKSS